MSPKLYGYIKVYGIPKLIYYFDFQHFSKFIIEY